VQGVDASGLTMMAWPLAGLTALVVLLLLVAALRMRRGLRQRDARIATLAQEGALAEQRAAERVERAERLAIEARARIEQLQQLSGLGSFDWDVASGRLAGSFAAQLGYAAHELAPHIDAWLRLVHPDDLPRLAPLLEQRDAAGAPDRLDGELRLRNAAGDWQWLRLAAQVVQRDAAGAALRIVGVQQDIGAQKRAEEALEAERRLFDHGPVIPLALDLEPPHALRDASQSLQRARRCRPGEALPIGAGLNDLLHRDDAAALRQAIARLKGGAAGIDVQREVRLLQANGRWCWHLLHLAIERGRGAALRGYLVDIERLKEAESQAASQSGDLQQVVQRMSSTQRFLQSVQQMTELLQVSESEADARGIVAQAGPELFPRWPGAVSMAGEGGAMEIAAAWGGFAPPARACAESDCWAVRRGRLHLVSAAGSARGLQPVCGHFGGALPEGVTHAICAPLLNAGARAGALHLVTSAALGEDEVRSAVWGAETAADALELSLANLRLRLSLREQAVRDWMTGLYNRRYFEEVLQRELSRSERAHDSLTLALFDIDHFKSFNDSFGHEAGDEVIKAVAKQLHGFVRSYDIACRVGGEELAVLLPRAHLQETCSRLDQLREQVGHLQIRHNGSSLPAVTVSIGVAAVGQGSGDDILRRADVALYAAKHGGRNRLMCWTPELESASFFGSFDDSQRVVSARGVPVSAQ
jgi:diguanylate cyclase (GGDEF)-like protein/PAS domain S-box-containing protein